MNISNRSGRQDEGSFWVTLKTVLSLIIAAMLFVGTIVFLNSDFRQSLLNSGNADVVADYPTNP